jgi:hypothetical protein
MKNGYCDKPLINKGGGRHRNANLWVDNVMSKAFFVSFVILVLLGDLFSIALVENHYQKDVIPQYQAQIKANEKTITKMVETIETSNVQIGMLREEIRKREVGHEGSEKAVYSKIEIIMLPRQTKPILS